MRRTLVLTLAILPSIARAGEKPPPLPKDARPQLAPQVGTEATREKPTRTAALKKEPLIGGAQRKLEPIDLKKDGGSGGRKSEVSKGKIEGSAPPKNEVSALKRVEADDSPKGDVPGPKKVEAIEPRKSQAKAKIREQKKPLCLTPPVHFTAGSIVSAFSLTTCSGEVAPNAIEKLSVMAQPRWASAPIELTKASTQAVSPRGKVDPGIVLRLDAIAKHFSKPGKPARFFVVSGYRPGSRGSLHASAKAFDVRVEGVRNEALVAFCKQLDDTGCGYYPNSTFVHVDVRRPGAGHVSWIDISGPGEDAQYVTAWPPKPGQREEPVIPTELVPKDLDEDGHGPSIEEIRPFDGDRNVETTENIGGPTPLLSASHRLDTVEQN